MPTAPIVKLRAKGGYYVRESAHCEGSLKRAVRVVDAERGACSVCGCVRLTYTSSVHGRHILVDHKREPSYEQEAG